MPHAFKVTQNHDEPNDAAGVVNMIFSDIDQGQQNADKTEPQKSKQGRSRRARNRATNYE